MCEIYVEISGCRYFIFFFSRSMDNLRPYGNAHSSLPSEERVDGAFTSVSRYHFYNEKSSHIFLRPPLKG